MAHSAARSHPLEAKRARGKRNTLYWSVAYEDLLHRNIRLPDERHDSEKVVGTLIQEGYSQVVDEADAGLILYNTCSIRDKAEQKVFHRLNEYKKMQGEGKKFAVLGCVAQQEGNKIFEKAPYVSMVVGSS